MTDGPQPIPLRCPRCAADVAPEQDWCLVCGAAARTRLAPTPNWKLPVTVLATIALLAGLALALAFAELTKDDSPEITQSQAAPTEPEAATAPTTDTVPTAPPATATTPAIPTVSVPTGTTITGPATTVTVPTTSTSTPTVTAPSTSTSP